MQGLLTLLGAHTRATADHRTHPGAVRRHTQDQDQEHHLMMELTPWVHVTSSLQRWPRAEVAVHCTGKQQLNTSHMMCLTITYYDECY